MQRSQLTTVSLILPNLSPDAFITLSIFMVSWEKWAVYICQQLQVESWPEPKYQVCVNWEMLQVFHRLLLVKLIFSFRHVRVVLSRVQSIFCLSAQSSSQLCDWGRSKWLWWRKVAQHVIQIFKMLNAWHWQSKQQFTQKQEQKYFSRCCLSQIH